MEAKDGEKKRIQIDESHYEMMPRAIEYTQNDESDKRKNYMYKLFNKVFGFYHRIARFVSISVVFV